MINNPKSAYLHIPFCHRRCFYCDFAVVPLGDNARADKTPASPSIDAYLKLLHSEIDLVRETYPLSTIYIGGGTPSLLTPFQINSLLEHLRKNFRFQPGVEISLEVDPASFDKNTLEQFLDIGINRLSLGGQSFDDELLKKIGRNHSRNQLIETCSWIDEMFNEGKLLTWSLDLIQNLPGHELDGWQSQLEEALRTSAPHFSIYDLTVEPGTVFDSKIKRGEITLPRDELAEEISRLTNQILTCAGFARYEISNYALPGHTSRHNRVYWSGTGWWGFGMGATSAPWGNRLERPRTREGYKQWLENQNENGLDPSLLSSNTRLIDLDEQLIVGLRKREGVDLEALGKSWGWNQEQYFKYIDSLKVYWKDFLDSGLLLEVGKRIVLSDPDGMDLSNPILVQMLLWWDSLPKDAVRSPKF